MGFLDMFRAKKQALETEGQYDVDAIKQSQRDLYRQKKDYNDARLKLDLELHKLKLEKEKIELESEIERAKFEQEMMREQRKQEFMDMFGGGDDEDEGIDSSLIKILGHAFMQKNAPQASAPATPLAPAQVTTLTHEQIKAQLNTLPPHYIALAKKMSDDDLRRFTIEQIPTLDAESTNRVVEVVRSL